MKSSINILVDYRETPFEREVIIRCPEEHIEKQMRHLTRGSKRTEQVETLKKGDVAVLALESVLPKFNRPMVPVTIGGGLFSKELEEQLIGHKVGENFIANVQGETVIVTVKQASRTVFPEPTDEMVVAYAEGKDELKGISTVEDYRRYVVETYCAEQKDQVIYGTMNTILEYVLTHSDWEFDEEELDLLAEDQKGYIQEELKRSEDKDFDSLTDEEISRYFGVTSREELEKMLRSECEREIAMALWAASCNDVDVREKSFDEAMSELTWNFLENYVRENVKIKEEN